MTTSRDVHGATRRGELLEEILKVLAFRRFVVEVIREAAKERWRGGNGARRSVHRSRGDGPHARSGVGIRGGDWRDSCGASRSIHHEEIDNRDGEGAIDLCRLQRVRM